MKRVKKGAGEPLIALTARDIENIKNQVAEEAVDKAFLLMLSIPVMIMHDKYPQLMKREVNGKPRVERFAELCLDLYDSFEQGYVTLDDLNKCLKEEAGITLIKG